MPRSLHSLLFSTTLLIISSACSSTDVIPADPADSPERITLNVSAPEAYGFASHSRTPAGYNLRLLAALYPAEGISSSLQPLETREMISESGVGILSFDIEKSGTYFITVFADYIPETAAKDEAGHYADMYYDTTLLPIVKVKDGNADFFNNDLRDCFAGKIVFTKGSAPLSRELTLKRPVSRIVVSAPGDAVEQLVSRVEITRCSHFPGYSFVLDDGVKCGGIYSAAGADAPQAEEVSIPDVYSAVEPRGKQLFYFYTFAATGSDTSAPALGEISFSLKAKEGISLSSSSRSISAGMIKPLSNYQVSVKGAAGWIDAEAANDDITVTLNVPTEWGDAEEID